MSIFQKWFRKEPQVPITGIEKRLLRDIRAGIIAFDENFFPSYLEHFSNEAGSAMMDLTAMANSDDDKGIKRSLLSWKGQEIYHALSHFDRECLRVGVVITSHEADLNTRLLAGDIQRLRSLRR